MQLSNPVKYTAKFTPEAWVNNYAISVDPQGPTQWDCTADVNALPHDIRYRVLAHGGHERDQLARMSGAPLWVQNWSGPFEIDLEQS